jgi:uncharacterized protein YqhQ
MKDSMINQIWAILKIGIFILIPILTVSWACDLLNSSSDMNVIAGLLLLLLTIGYIIYWLSKLYFLIEEK